MIALVRQTAEEHGRDPDAIEITTGLPDDLDTIPDLAAAGVDRLLVPVTSMAGLKTVISSPEDALNWRDLVEKYADT